MATYQDLAQALQNAHRAGDTAAAQKLAQALKGMQAQQQTQFQDSSLGTAFKFGEAKSRADAMNYAADVNQVGEQGLYGRLTKAGQEYIGNPVREALGFDPIDPNYAQNKIEQQRQQAAALNQKADALNYKSLTTDDVTGVGSALRFGAQKAVESAPYMATAITAPLLTPILTAGSLNAGMKDIEGLSVEDRVKLATAGGTIQAVLENIGAAAVVKGIPPELLGKLGVKGVSDLLNKNGMGRIVKAFTSGIASEGATEFAQESVAIGTEAIAGRDFQEGEIGSRLKEATAAGAAAGGTIRGTGQTAVESVNAVRRTPQEAADPEAAADLAQRLKAIATANNYNLNDVNKTSTKGARETVDKAHIQIVQDIKRLSKDLKTRLDVKDTDELSVVLDKVLSAAGKRQAKNKTKNTVGQQEMDAIQRLTGNTAEGQRMLSLMRQSNELTELHNSGYVGGVSKYTDMLNPIRTDVGYSTTSAVEIPTRIAGTLYGATINPLIPAAQAATVGAGRVIGKVTGNRSIVNRFVRQNQGNQGIQQPSAPSLRVQAQQKEQRAELEKQLQSESDALEQQLTQQEALSRRRAAYMNQDLPAAGSPEATMVIATEGVDQKTLEQLVAYIGQARPELKDSADAYLAAIRGETLSDVPGLTELIRAVKTFVDNTPQFAAKKNPQLAARISENFTTPVAASAAGVPGYMNTPGYQRGIADNQAAADSLTESVNNDASISTPDKAKLLDGLAQLRSNLGTNPAGKVVDIYNSIRDKLTDKALADTYMLPYVERVAGQQPNNQEGTMEDMAAPAIGEGLSIFPKTQKLYKMIDGLEVDQGNYVNTADGSDVTGKSYNGARIYIKPDGKPAMEVDQNEVSTPTKEFGLRWDSNAVRPDRYKFVDNPTNHQGSIVTVEGRTSTSSDNKQKHYFALQYASDVPVELHRRKGGEPTMRPRGFGIIKPGNQIGTISMGGRENPLYDEIRIEPVQKIDAPLSYEMDPFSIGEDMGLTALDIMPNDQELADMKAGIFKPKEKVNKEVVYGRLHEKFVNVTGSDKPLEYTPENTERIARIMATEALAALEKDGNAIGWYDSKLKAAKSVMRLVEPRIDESENAFDFALAVTSNGQAVLENFKYALDVYRHYLDNGSMPEKFKQGGKRNKAMRAAFAFYNAYEKSGRNMSIEQFLNIDYDVKELKEFLTQFNEQQGTNISIGSQENQNATVKGSYVLGAKIGQGFYQNIRGNYEPLTMDLWWMRMWNRMVGRPFSPPKTEQKMNENRKFIYQRSKTAKGTMADIVESSLNDIGHSKETFANVYSDPDLFDQYAAAAAKRYQNYYLDFQVRNKKNPSKSALFARVGTHVDNLSPQLQATPAGGGERQYMREVVNRSRELLKERGYDINTADFQALMWFPEKQLARKLGIPPGKGDDNDYLDAAIAAAAREGIDNEQIKEALPEAERGRLDSRTGTPGQDGQADRRSDRTGTEEGEAIDEQDSGSFRRSYQSIPAFGSRTVEPVEIRDQLELAKQLFAEGKPLPIGMPGTPFENGIQDVRVVELIAKSLGYGFEIFANPNQYKKGMKNRFDKGISGKALGGLFSNADPTKMVYDQVENTPLRGFLATKSTYQNKKDNKDYITLPESIFAALHELGHALERLPFVDTEQVSSTQTKTTPRPSNSILGVMNTPDGSLLYTDGRVRNNTFRGYLAHLVNAFGNKISAPKNIKSDLDFTDAELENIVSEVLELQRTGLLTIQGVGEVMPRPTYSDTQYLVQQGDTTMYDANEFIKKTERTYFHKPQELAADMIGSYMLDPAGFKRKAPTAAKFVRDLLNTANAESSKFVKFYSAPLAMVVATIMAQLMLGEQEEEDKKGALSLGQAALTV